MHCRWTVHDCGQIPGELSKVLRRTQHRAEQSRVLTAFLCFGFATLVRTDNYTDTTTFRQSSPSFVCLPHPTHSTSQTVLWQGCVQNALQNPKIPQSIIIVCYQCSMLSLAELCLIFPSFQHRRFIKPVHEILLNVTGKCVSLQWHYNNVSLQCQVMC